jgi:hypothetical protein
MAKPPASGGGAEAALPPKEHALFRSIVKFYDSKQYKKGVKAADAVLKCVCGGSERERERERRGGGG